MSTSFLSRIFCCFPALSKGFRGGDGAGGTSTIDESSHLITPNLRDDTTSGPTNVYADQQRLKDRLGSIVQAKEGRMVNVNAPPPFHSYGSTSNYFNDYGNGTGSRSRSESDVQSQSPPSQNPSSSSLVQPDHPQRSVLFTEQPLPVRNMDYPTVTGAANPTTSSRSASLSRSTRSRESSRMRSNSHIRHGLFNARLVENSRFGQSHRRRDSSRVGRSNSIVAVANTSSAAAIAVVDVVSPTESLLSSPRPSLRGLNSTHDGGGLGGQGRVTAVVLDPIASAEADEAARVLAERLKDAPALSLSWDD